MAYVPVPKDFSKIKTKLALNLTKRQIICFSLAGICGVPVYLLTKAGLGTDVAATLMIIVMLPFFFFAMYEKDGFPAEKILLHIIRQKFLRPGIRVYRSQNLYDRIIEYDKLEKEGAWLENRARTLSIWCFFAQCWPMFQDEVVVVNSTYNPVIYNIVSALALIANVAVFVFMIYKSVQKKKNPWTNSIYDDMDGYKKIAEQAEA